MLSYSFMSKFADNFINFMLLENFNCPEWPVMCLRFDTTTNQAPASSFKALN